MKITTWDGNLTACPAWQWPFARRQPAAARRRHHGSLGSNRAAGCVSGRPEWCLSAAPGARPSPMAAYLGKSQGSAHAASLNHISNGESRWFSLTQTFYLFLISNLERNRHKARAPCRESYVTFQTTKQSNPLPVISRTKQTAAELNWKLGSLLDLLISKQRFIAVCHPV